MLQQMNDPYDKLLSVLQRVIAYQSLLPLERGSNFCFLSEFSKISFEELTNHPNNYAIQTLVEDNYIFLKRITKRKINFYICSVTHRDQNIIELLESQNIAMIIVYLLIKSKDLKVHYVLNKTNAIAEITEITKTLQQNKNLTIVTINQDQKSFNRFQDQNSFRAFSGLQLLEHILISQFQVEEKYNYFETQSTYYLQEYVDEFIEQLQIKIQLKTLQLNIDVYSQFPRTDSKFKFVFSNMIQSLQERLNSTQGNNKYIQMIKAISQVTKRFSFALDQNLKQMKKEGYQSVIDFCKEFGIDYERISFSFRLDAEKFGKIERAFEILDLDSINWETLELQQISALVSYIRTYYDEEIKFDIDSFLQKFQTPMKVEPNENCVFVFGLTKAGKSTITSIIENPDNIIYEIEDCQEVYKKQNNNETYSIKNGCFSNNQRKIEKLQFNNLIIFDCPGVNDTDEQFRISNIFNISQQISMVKNPIFLIIINTSDESNFLQNLKETIKYFNILSNDLFIQKNLQLIFILTKINLIQTQDLRRTFIDKLVENQEKEIYTKNDFRDYEQHFRKFFDSFKSGRVLYFPHARQNSNFDLQKFKQQIFEVIDETKATQQQVYYNRSFNISQTEQQLFNELKEAVDYRMNLTINFILQNIINTVLLEKKQGLDDKLSKVENLSSLLCQNKTQKIYQIIEMIEEWMQQNYKIKTLDSMRFLQFEQAQKIFEFDFQEKIEQYLKQLKIIEQEIRSIISKEIQILIAKMIAISGITAGMCIFFEKLGGLLAGTLFQTYFVTSLVNKTSIVSKFMYSKLLDYPTLNQKLQDRVNIKSQINF